MSPTVINLSTENAERTTARVYGDPVEVIRQARSSCPTDAVTSGTGRWTVGHLGAVMCRRYATGGRRRRATGHRPGQCRVGCLYPVRAHPRDNDQARRLADAWSRGRMTIWSRLREAAAIRDHLGDVGGY